MHRAASAPISRAATTPTRNAHRAALAPTSRAESMPVSRDIPTPTIGGACSTTLVFAPRGEDAGSGALEARIIPHKHINQDCDLFPNSETEPTRVRRMRGEVPQQGDPSGCGPGRGNEESIGNIQPAQSYTGSSTPTSPRHFWVKSIRPLYCPS